MTQKQFKELIKFFKHNKIHIHGVVYVFYGDEGWSFKPSGSYDYRFKKENKLGAEISERELKLYRSASAMALYTEMKMR